MRFDAIIFDFDGVLVESEYVSSRHLAGLLTELGHPTSVEQALDAFTGLGGSDFLDAVATHVGGEVPDDFHALRRAEDERAVREGVGAVAGAVDFVRALPPDLPKAVASSSTTAWIRAHLAHIGLANAFGEHIYSGREHVRRGKPAPDLYLYAARALGVDIARTAVIEDSPVGVIGAAASGAHVIGLAAARHCGPDHLRRLRDRGAHDVVTSFAEIVL